MMARLVDMQATMYAEPDRTSTVIADLSQGEELRITDRPTSGDDDWITVALPDERRGYLPSGTKIDGVPIVELEQDAAIRAEPSETSPVLVTYGLGAKLWLLGAVAQDGRTWLKVSDADGIKGFIPEGTRLADTRPQSSVQVMIARGKRNMLVGGLWCGGGLAVTLYTHATASGGGTYVVAWGAIIFGGWQAIKGLAQYMGSGES